MLAARRGDAMMRGKSATVYPRCSQIHGIGHAPNVAGNLYCTDCAEADEIPAGCDLACGAPLQMLADRCRLAYKCPCATYDSVERKRAMAQWRLHNGHRKLAVAVMLRGKM